MKACLKLETKYKHTVIDSNLLCFLLSIRHMLYILTSVWVLMNPDAGQNMLFLYWAMSECHLYGYHSAMVINHDAGILHEIVNTIDITFTCVRTEP